MLWRILYSALDSDDLWGELAENSGKRWQAIRSHWAAIKMKFIINTHEQIGPSPSFWLHGWEYWPLIGQGWSRDLAPGPSLVERVMAGHKIGKNVPIIHWLAVNGDKVVWSSSQKLNVLNPKYNCLEIYIKFTAISYYFIFSVPYCGLLLKTST